MGRYKKQLHPIVNAIIVFWVLASLFASYGKYVNTKEYDFSFALFQLISSAVLSICFLIILLFETIDGFYLFLVSMILTDVFCVTIYTIDKSWQQLILYDFIRVVIIFGVFSIKKNGKPGWDILNERSIFKRN